MKPLFFASLLATLFLSACISTTEKINTSTTYDDIKKFSHIHINEHSTEIKDKNPLLGWYPWSLTPSKSQTSYTLQRYQGKTVIHADADSSASGLMVPLKPRSVDGHELVWEWKALGHIEDADNTQSHTDDAPLRIFLAFDGDKTKLSLKDQMAFELAQLISGQELPYATLMYIWSSIHHNKQIIPNKYTSRLKMIIVDSGDEHIGTWRRHQRDIQEDFRNAFQEEPGKLIAVGIMTDTDNTKSLVKAIYGDIEIKRK